MAVTLGGDRPTLEVRFAGSDETYHIPLSGSFSLADAMSLDKARKEEKPVEWFVGFFKRHIPEELVDSMSMRDLQVLMRAWDEESREDGPDAGES